MSDPVVPSSPPIPNDDGIVGGSAVTSPQWVDLGGLSNHLLGRGACLIPAMVSPTSAGGTYHFRAKTRAQTVRREWVFVFDDLGGSGLQAGTFEIYIPATAGSPTRTVVAPAGQYTEVRIYEDVDPQAEGDSELTFKIL